MTIELLKEIKLIVFDTQSHHYLPLSVYKTLRTFMMSRQDKHVSRKKYREAFQNQVTVLDQ